MRQQIAAGNWKMNLTFEQGVELAKKLVEQTPPTSALMILCTPFVHLHAVHQIIKHSPHIKLGAQNCHTHTSGAYTGETSVEMLKSVGVEYVVLGHSERREYFHEDNAFLAAKVNTVLAAGLKPIFCCGESLEIRQSGDYIAFVTRQIQESLFHLTAEQMGSVVIAYEPIWAIGTGMTATPEQAQEMQQALRRFIATQYGEAVADARPILYGGSVKGSNAAELFSCADVDGGLVGGASLNADDFTKIYQSF